MEERVPEIRFKGFEEEWTQQRLGDIAKLNGRIGFRGYTEKDIVSKEDGGILAFSPTNIVDNVINVNCKNTYITRSKFEESPEIQIHNGDIIFVKTGSTLGKSALISNLSEEATLNPQVVVLRVKNNEQFFASLMTTKDVMDQITSSKIGGAVPTLTETRIKDFSISIPISNNEKNNLGNLFHSMDTLITLQQQKLDKLKTFKKSCLEKMFPRDGETVPEVRFQGFEGPWEKRKLGELGSVCMCRRVFKEQTTEKGDVPFFKIGTFGGQADSYISNELFDDYKAKYPYPKQGDILLSASGSIGRTVEYLGEKAYFQDSNIVWLNHADNLNNSFLKHFYSIVKWSGVEGSTIKRLYNEIILNTSIYLPSIVEQKEIGSYFCNLDNQISLYQQKLDKLKSLKQACLEKMFV